jgi:hypothetical protein
MPYEARPNSLWLLQAPVIHAFLSNAVGPVIFASVLLVFGSSRLTWRSQRRFHVSDLIVVTYADECRAAEVLAALQRLQEEMASTAIQQFM